MYYNFQKKMLVKSDHGGELFVDIVDMISAGNCMDATIICQNGRLKQNSFLLSVLFPMFRNSLENHYQDLVISMPDMDVQDLEMFFQNFMTKSMMDFDIGENIYELMDLHRFINLKTIQPKKEQSPAPSLSTCNDKEKLTPVKIRISNIKETSSYFDAKDEQDNATEESNNLKEPEDGEEEEESSMYDKVCDDDDYGEAKEEASTDVFKMEGEVDNEMGNKNAVSKSKYVRNDHGKFKCDLCDKVFSHVRNVSKHKQVVHQGITYDCDECGKQFSHSSSLKEHIQIKHSGAEKTYFNCNQCEKKFLRQSHLNTHIRSKHLNMKYSCDYCEAQFTTSSAMKQHVRIIHEGIKDAFSCDLCGNKFSRRNNLLLHIKDQHQNTEDHPCNTCGKMYKTSGSLKDHISKYHSDGPEEKIICIECGKQFRTKSKLKYHMDSVHDETTYPCDICESSFSHPI